MSKQGETKEARGYRINLPVTLRERKQVQREASEAKLNTTDYVRSKLGLPIARGKRNHYEKAPEPPPGDPENAVDVEELAKEIYAAGPPGQDWSYSMSDARREAKRRLKASAEANEA